MSEVKYVVIFNTEAEAEARQVEDLATHITYLETLPDPKQKFTKYKAQTKQWALPRPRLDGRFDYGICTHANYAGFEVKEYNQDDYPQDEE